MDFPLGPLLWLFAVIPASMVGHWLGRRAASHLPATFTRIEVIDEAGRVYVRDNRDEKLDIEVVAQDDHRTMKIFVKPLE